MSLPVSGRKDDVVKRLEDYQGSRNMNIGVFVDQVTCTQISKKEIKDGKPPSCASYRAKMILVELHLKNNNPVHKNQLKKSMESIQNFRWIPFLASKRI